MLSVVARFVQSCYDKYGGTIEASIHFANLARKEALAMSDEITLTNIHCQLILSVYELGHGNEHRAWLQLGVANRICQAMGLLYESSYSSDDAITAEIKRRTFWSCFAMERFLVNGRDRPLLEINPPPTAYLPTSASDFTVGRITSTSTISDDIAPSDTLPALMIRIIDLLGRIVAWGAAGVGGRHVDPRLPWLEDMPFSRLQKELQAWNDTIPPYLRFTEINFKSHRAGLQERLFGLMHIFYMMAGLRLHRKYLPFIPPILYDPAYGPTDGPGIIPGPDSTGFWAESARLGIRFANQISTTCAQLESHDPDIWATPFLGLPLMASSSFHVFCVHSHWESCDEFVGEPARKLLTYNLRSLMKLQETWPVAAFWVCASPIDLKIKANFEQDKVFETIL